MLTNCVDVINVIVNFPHIGMHTLCFIAHYTDINTLFKAIFIYVAWNNVNKQMTMMKSHYFLKNTVSPQNKSCYSKSICRTPQIKL